MQLGVGKHKYYIVGDFNINIDDKNRSVNSDMYLNMISSNGGFFPIDKHTRVKGNSRSLIDHVITNDISNTIFPCVFISDISDYFPIEIIVERKNKQHDNSRYNKLKQPYFLEIKKNLIMIVLLIICNHL